MKRWHVAVDNTITGPFGRRFTGAPTQRAAINLAHSMAGIDRILEHINRPQLTVVKAGPTARRAYGFGPVTPRAAQ